LAGKKNHKIQAATIAAIAYLFCKRVILETMKGHGDEENQDHWSLSSTESEVGSSTGDDLERDEVQEVHKTQRKDTRRLRLWRFVVTGVLLVTALAVTLTTYRFLQDEQQNNFKTAVRIIVKAAHFFHCTDTSKIDIYRKSIPHVKSLIVLYSTSSSPARSLTLPLYSVTLSWRDLRPMLRLSRFPPRLAT
jgi:hypothetical protein